MAGQSQFCSLEQAHWKHEQGCGSAHGLCVGRDRIELLLAIGSSRWEATREAIAKSLKVACMPIINQMNVVGLVSIPGMMTGQILGGTNPSQVFRAASQVQILTPKAFSLVSGTFPELF